MNEHTHVDGIYPFPPVMQTRTVETNGTAIHVRVGGHGPAVVMLHGFGTTGDIWGHLREPTKRRAHGVAPDLRGLGLSAKPDAGYDNGGNQDALLRNVGLGRFETHQHVTKSRSAI